MAFGDGLRFSVGLDLAKAERQLTAFGARAASIGDRAASIGTSAAKIGIGIAAGFTAAGLALKSVLQSSVDMESFESRLTTIMGSASGAKARLGELFDFAATTPFNLDQVVSADTTLRGFGANADTLLPKLIDFSAALGTDLTQSAIDFGKAWNQGGAGLESDTGKILKSMIETRAGVKTADMDIQTFRKNMEEVLGEKFAGGAERMSRTFAGMVSNLQDEWSRFTMLINDAGLFDNVKGALSYTLELIGRNREETAGWARVISEGVWSGIKLVATGIAGIVDSTVALGSVFLTLKAYGLDIAAAFVGVNAAILDASASIAEMAGLKGAGVQREMADAALADQVALEGAAQATRDMVNALGDGGSALSETEAFFSAAEKAAQGFKGAVEDVNNPAKAPAEMGGDGKAEAKRKAAQQKLLTDQIEAALDFSADMRALNQSETQALMAEYAKRMGALLEYNRQGLITEQLFADTRVAIEQNYQDQVDAIREKAAQEERARQQTYAMEILQQTSALFGALQGLMDQQNAEQKAMYKAFGIGQVAISTAIGISRAFADYGWPGGIAPAALTAATGAAQIAAIASAHQGTSGEPVVYMHQGGGPRRPSPDEMDVRKLRTEAVLNSQATRALGPQGVNALNSGAGMAPMMVDLKVGRVTQREMFRTEIRTAGSRLTRYVEEVGRSGDKAAGFSGGVARA